MMHVMIHGRVTCGEQDIVVSITVWCMYMCVCVRPSEFVRPNLTSTIVDGFHNNFTHFFFIMCRCAILNILSSRPKVKVTLEGQIFCPDHISYNFGWISI